MSMCFLPISWAWLRGHLPFHWSKLHFLWPSKWEVIPETRISNSGFIFPGSLKLQVTGKLFISPGCLWMEWGVPIQVHSCSNKHWWLGLCYWTRVLWVEYWVWTWENIYVLEQIILLQPLLSNMLVGLKYHWRGSPHFLRLRGRRIVSLVVPSSVTHQIMDNWLLACWDTSYGVNEVLPLVPASQGASAPWDSARDHPQRKKKRGGGLSKHLEVLPMQKGSLLVPQISPRPSHGPQPLVQKLSSNFCREWLLSTSRNSTCTELPVAWSSVKRFPSVVWVVLWVVVISGNICKARTMATRSHFLDGMWEMFIGCTLNLVCSENESSIGKAFCCPFQMQFVPAVKSFIHSVAESWDSVEYTLLSSEGAHSYELLTWLHSSL